MNPTLKEEVAKWYNRHMRNMFALSKVERFFLFGSIFIFFVLILWFAIIAKFSSPFGITVNTSRASVIKQMRSLSRLETASFTIEKVIDAGTTGGNVFQQFLFGDKILLVAHGQVIAGFDLSQMSDRDIKVSGKTLRFTLPPPQIFVATLDNTQTKVYDRKRGLLADSNTDLESKARSAAETSIKEAACKGDILSQASENARKQLTSLFTSLGFETVTITIPTGTCN